MQKILIVEDDTNLSKMYVNMLKDEGYEVFTARDKNSALETALKEDVGFILLDFMLAENTNGMSFLEDLQSSKKGNLIPTVFLTNNVNEEEKEKAIALGAKDYLPKAKQKPSDIIDLVKRHVV